MLTVLMVLMGVMVLMVLMVLMVVTVLMVLMVVTVPCQILREARQIRMRPCQGWSQAAMQCIGNLALCGRFGSLR